MTREFLEHKAHQVSDGGERQISNWHHANSLFPQTLVGAVKVEDKNQVFSGQPFSVAWSPEAAME